VLAGQSATDAGTRLGQDESASIGLGWWLASVIEGAGLSTVARNLFEELRQNDASSASLDPRAISDAVAAAVEENTTVPHGPSASPSLQP
jgi:hypothetical protein